MKRRQKITAYFRAAQRHDKHEVGSINATVFHHQPKALTMSSRTRIDRAEKLFIAIFIALGVFETVTAYATGQWLIPVLCFYIAHLKYKYERLKADGALL